MSDRSDVSRLLGATGPGAWALAALFGGVHATIAFWVDTDYTGSPLGLAGLAAMVGAAVLVVHPRFSPFPHSLAATVVAATVFTTAAGLWQLDESNWRGWVTWYIGASSYLAFALALRGRFWWGVGDLVALSIVAGIWRWSLGGSPLGGLELVYPQLIMFGAGSFFALWLRRTANRIAAFQETRLRRESAEGARVAAEAERAREVQEIRQVVGAALDGIAAGATDETSRRDHALLEAELRDRIRGRRLATGPLSAAVREARTRGVTVAVLDDVRSPSRADPLTREALGWASERLAQVRAGEVTIRLARSEGGDVVTLATADGGVERLAVSGG